MTIEIVIHCYSYQHRLNWMLCSILQQKGKIPNIIVSVSYLADNGNPTTEKVLDFFEDKGLNIIRLPLEKGQESNRAIPRNIRTEKTEADWILFADCDLVYDPLFFEDLKTKLESDKYRNVEVVMGADRHSLDIPFCIKYFEEDKREYPCIIDNISEIAKNWPKRKISGKHVAAGYFQLASVKVIRNKKLVYSGRRRDVWRATRSDREFRIIMGGRVPIDVLPMYHLNHDRNGPDIQR
jgi:hypothetical protein